MFLQEGVEIQTEMTEQAEEMPKNECWFNSVNFEKQFSIDEKSH